MLCIVRYNSKENDFKDVNMLMYWATTVENINGRLIPTAEVTSLREQTTKARITEIYLVFKKTNLTNFFVLYCTTVEPTMDWGNLFVISKTLI